MPKNKYTSSFKVKAVLEALKDPDGTAAYCRRKGISDALIHKWKSQMIEHTDSLFEIPSKAVKDKIQKLEEKLRNKDQIIAAVTEEALELNKILMT